MTDTKMGPIDALVDIAVSVCDAQTSPDALLACLDAAEQVVRETLSASSR
jgi:hypothetical protein